VKSHDDCSSQTLGINFLNAAGEKLLGKEQIKALTKAIYPSRLLW